MALSEMPPSDSLRAIGDFNALPDPGESCAGAFPEARRLSRSAEPPALIPPR